MAKASSIRDLTINQISARIELIGRELLTARQELVLGKLKNYRRLRVLRLERARLRTVLDEKITASVKQ